MTYKDYGLDDPELLSAAEHMAPDLMFALRVAQAAKALGFPLLNHDSMMPIFANRDDFTAGSITITKAQFASAFPENFFPITSAAEVARHVFVVLAGAHITERDALLKKHEAMLPLDGAGNQQFVTIVDVPEVGG